MIGKEFSDILDKLEKASRLRYGNSAYAYGFVETTLAYRIMPLLPEETRNMFMEDFKDRIKNLEQEVMMKKLKGDEKYD